ncbi:hypothetical protein B0H13DRAFT_1903722 [Mycena leptocephala]|nr:hypothetical protein B0H13DRAFT_1903722 [Mycena leptocephala]
MARSNKPTPTVSTYSTRNPTRAVQPTRKRSKKSGASKATDALKAAQRLQERISMDADVSAFYDYKDTLVKTLAAKYNRTLTHFRKLLSNGTQYSTTRSVSLWNAIIHDLSLKAKEAGDPSDLKTIRADFSKEDYEEMKETLSDEEEKRLRKQLRDHRELKQRGIRATNRAAAADAMQNANRVGDVIMDLYERTGVRGIALFTRGHPDDPSVPHVVDSDETRSFFQEALGVSVLDVLRLLEQWSCTRDKATKNDRDTAQKEVAELLSAGLRKIKNNKSVSMVYTNYKQEIVHKLGVELAGWPADIKVQRPSKMPAENVRSIRDKLRAGAICWVALTRAQRDKVADEMDVLRAKGELKKRKERSDKGLTRGSRADEEDEDSDNEEGDESDSDDESDKEDEDIDASNAPARTVDASTAAAASIAQAVASPPAAPADTIFALAMATPLPIDNPLQGGAIDSALPAFDFENIDWDSMPPPSFDWSNSGFDGTSPEDLAFAALHSLQPQSAFDAGMPPLPSSYRSEGGVDDDSEFPLALSTAVTGLSSTMGGAGVSASVFGLSTNLVDSGRKRKSGDDAGGARGQKKARNDGSGTASGDDDGPGGGENSTPTPAASSAPTNAASSVATKPRKKRSDAGKPRGSSTKVAKAAAGRESTKPRKKRSDAGVRRGPRD